MAALDNWAWTDFSQKGTLELRLDGHTFDIVQFSMTYAVNEIPRAVCLVPIGRNVRTQKQAPIHEFGFSLEQMLPATVWFNPTTDWDSKHQAWPEGPKCIFQGYYVGVSYTKLADKVQPVLHLVSWLCDLGFSSILSHNQHPANPAGLVLPSVTPPSEGAGTAGPPLYITTHFGDQTIEPNVESDFWRGVKEVLCQYAEIDKFHIECKGCGGGSGDKKKNDRALKALKKFEGPSPKCSLDYHYAKAAKLDTQGVPLVKEAVAESISHTLLEAFAHTTFWDQVTSNYCSQFNMAVIPLVDRALIVPDVPPLQTPYKTIYPEEYTDLELSGMVARPLMGVGVTADYETLTGFASTQEIGQQHLCLGGHYAVAGKDPPQDGVWMVIPAPIWLAHTPSVGLYAGYTTGTKEHKPNNTSTTPRATDPPPDPTPADIIPKLCKLYTAYAKSVYLENTLRSRTGMLTGKIRFDISPGSQIKIASQGDSNMMEGTDKLAHTMFAYVERVSFNINAESQLASTTFQLAHIRTEKENENERTSTTSHPLFTDDSLFYGCGLNATEEPDGKPDTDWEFNDDDE